MRLSNRVVEKPDGRYLIYYERSAGPVLPVLSHKA
jgi:hypothetical protein